MSFLNSANAKKSSIVITGGGSGIGLAIAGKLAALGHEVIIAGRRLQQLELAKAKYPTLHIVQADVESDEGRIAFHKKIVKDFPNVNVLINNAGVSHPLPPLNEQDAAAWAKNKSTLAINLDAPIHLSILFLPHLTAKENALIANVSSVVAYFPFVNNPVYSASKAALHSFTTSLRHQLKETAVKVVEIAPPAVSTDMNKMDSAMNVDVYAEDVIVQLLEGKNDEIGYQSDAILRGSRDFLDGLVEQFSKIKFNADGTVVVN